MLFEYWAYLEESPKVEKSILKRKSSQCIMSEALMSVKKVLKSFIPPLISLCFDTEVVVRHIRRVRDAPDGRSFDSCLQTSSACWLDISPTCHRLALMSRARETRKARKTQTRAAAR